MDIEPEMVRRIHHKAMAEGITNVEAIVAKPDEPHATEDADLVFICDVLHHVPERPRWLRRLFAKLGASARLVLIGFKEGELPQGPPAGAKIGRKELEALVRGAGFGQVRTDDELLPYQVLLRASKLAGG